MNLLWPLCAACLGFAMLAPSAGLQNAPKVNADSLVAKEFSDRVSAYVALHKKANGKISSLKETDSAEEITAHQQALAQEIKAERQNAKRGEIFTADASVLFRKLLAASFNSSEGRKVRASLRHAEPVRNVRLAINGEYPPTAPLQSTPPSLLLNLPRLPKEVEYRIVGRDLVLRDVGANLIVDVATGVMPSI